MVNLNWRSAAFGRMAKTGDSYNKDENGKKSGVREWQVIDVGKRYRDISSAVVGNGADGAIIIVVLLAVVMVKGDQQQRAHHYH